METIDLAAAQGAVYQALREAAGANCFVRRCADDGALWVTDLPRRARGLSQVQEALEALGVAFTQDAAGLWRLDWTAQAWRERVEGLPRRPPALPADEALHPAYALCRLLLLHPAPMERQPMEPLRAVVKRAAGGRDAMLSAVAALHGDAARRLREGRPLAQAAGRALAAWLTAQERANG